MLAGLLAPVQSQRGVESHLFLCYWVCWLILNINNEAVSSLTMKLYSARPKQTPLYYPACCHSKLFECSYIRHKLGKMLSRNV